MAPSAFRQVLPELSAALKSFQASDAAFRVIRTVKSASHANHEPSPPQTLLILDSSFNPPSRAHRSMALSAMAQEALDRYKPPYRLLLLFSTQNADKAPSAASFDQRLALMTLFASDLQKSRPEVTIDIDIDIGLTTAPYYTDKSAAITAASEKTYGSTPRHVHLIGYDTLTRFFAAKYYRAFDPPLSALGPYFAAGHELRVTLRPDAEYGSVEEQEDFVAGVGRGDLEADGADGAWARQIVAVQDEVGVGVSSTKVRRAAGQEDWAAVEALCTPSIAQAVREEAIYG